MTNQQHPAQLDWATELSDAQEHITLSAQEANEIGARLRSMGDKLKAYEDLDEAASDVQLLRIGYAAARLEIESLQARIKTMAEEHADELMVAHLDGRMRAAKVMPESIRSILVRCRNFIDTTKVPAYPAGADLADEIDVLLAAQPAGEYPALPKPGRRGPAGTGSYFDSFTADQMRAYVDADRAMRAAQPAGAQQPGAAYAALPGLFREALAWGMTYGPEIPAHQWDEMRESMVKQYTERASHEQAPAGLAVPSMSADEVNAIPTAARAYIHQLATNTDPAGMVRENMQLRDTNAWLQSMYRKAADAAQEVVGCFHAAECEGLQAALAGTADEHLKDLVERRLMHALYAAQEVAGQAPAQAAPAAVVGPSLYQIMAAAKAIHETTTDADDWDALRQCEVDALRGRAEKVLAALSAAPTTQTAPQQEAQEPVAWYVTGCSRLLDEDEAKAEARHIGGTARAIPLYTAPQADSVTAPVATVIKKGADRQWMSERLGHLPDGIYSLYLAPPAQPSPASQWDALIAATSTALEVLQKHRQMKGDWPMGELGRRAAEELQAARHAIFNTARAALAKWGVQPSPASQENELDTARLDWLDKNIFHREMSDWDAKYGHGSGYNMWVLFAPKGHQGSARNIIDAARKQGANHD